MRKLPIPLLLLLLIAPMACSNETPESTPVPTIASVVPSPTVAPPPTSEPVASPTTVTPSPTVPSVLATPEPALTAEPGQVKTKNTLVEVWPFLPQRDFRRHPINEVLDIGTHEPLFNYQDGNPMTPHLATGWEISPDGMVLTVNLQEGIPFNSPIGSGLNFGEMTANDVVSQINDLRELARGQGSLDAIAGFAPIADARVVDDYTVELHHKRPRFTDFVGVNDYNVPIMGVSSDRAWTDMGEEWSIRNVVGTGPMVGYEWDSDGGPDGTNFFLETVPDHWNGKPDIDGLRAVVASSPDEMFALIATGRADFAKVNDFIARIVIKEGGTIVENTPGVFTGQSIIFPGNLWSEVDPVSGMRLSELDTRIDYPEPWESSVYERDYPWIGNPWGDRVPYIDDDNPPGMSDMEQARLVRLALSIALDREAIVRDALEGEGHVLYSEYMSTNYEGWDPSRMAPPMSYATGEIIEDPTSTQRTVPWKLEHSVSAARDLLVEAGYPDGFTIPLSLAGETFNTNLIVGDYIKDMWAAIGVQTELDAGSYSPFREQMFAREQWRPILRNGNVPTNTLGLDRPYPASETVLSRDGFGTSESPFLTKQLLDILGSKDRSFREREHLRAADYMIYWQLYSGVFQVPHQRAMINPDTIESWEVPPNNHLRRYAPQYIRLVDR